MGILDIFRKQKNAPPEFEEINFDDIQNWLHHQNKEIIKKEDELFDSINKKIKLSIEEINNKIKILKEINIDSKKVEEKIKIIVKQSRDKYLNFVDIFTEELTNIKKQNLRQFVSDINKIFLDFDKHSYIFYQRTTFLIGEEITAVRQEINNLSDYFSKLFSKNQKILDFCSIIPFIKKKLEQLDEINKTINKINSKIKVLDRQIEDNQKQEKKIFDKIEDIKTSQNYISELKKQEEIKLSKKQLENEISKLKSDIDFKMLSRAFHSDENKMKIIKSYKNDFRGNFSKDYGAGILDLINQIGLSTNLIADKINKIKQKQQITENMKFIESNKIKTLTKESQQIKLNTENLVIEKVKHLKRCKKTMEIKENIEKLMEQNTEKLGCKITFK